MFLPRKTQSSRPSLFGTRFCDCPRETIQARFPTLPLHIPSCVSTSINTIFLLKRVPISDLTKLELKLSHRTSVFMHEYKVALYKIGI